MLERTALVLTLVDGVWLGSVDHGSPTFDQMHWAVRPSGHPCQLHPHPVIHRTPTSVMLRTPVVLPFMRLDVYNAA